MNIRLAPRRSPYPRICAALLVAGIAGCGGAPEPAPLVAPPVEIDALHFAGSLVTGATLEGYDPEMLTPENSYGLNCRIFYLERMPRTALEPLRSQSTLVVGDDTQSGNLQSGGIARHARIGTDEAASRLLRQFEAGDPIRTIELANLEGLVTHGISVGFVAGSAKQIIDPFMGPVRRSAAVLVSRSGDQSSTAIEVAVLFQQLRIAEQEEAEPDESPVERQIMLLADEPELDGPPLLLLLPSPFAGDEGSGYAFALSATPPSDDYNRQALVQWVAEHLEATTREVHERGQQARLSDADVKAVRRGQLALNLVREQRQSLVFLTTATGADLALDLALSADESTLAEWIQALQAEIDRQQDEDQEKASREFGWRLEHSAWVAMAKRQASGDLSPDLSGLLLRHGGELARHPQLLDQVIRGAVDLETLRARLATGNRSFLDDNDPAARTRAHDWLESRGQAIPDYDPLAPRSQRSEALERHLNDGAGREGEE